jgi:tRNA threonylcarbamoyladenosine biosynthesis protein TsaE
MKRATYTIENEAEMDRFGRALAAALPSRAVIGLVGTLGAGKTRLVRAMAESWGVPSEEIGSPTFVLCRQYDGARRAYHLDAYRLTDESELIDLGFEELLAQDAIVLLEWADRAPGCLPDDHLTVQIEVLSEEARLVTVSEHGASTGVIDKIAWPTSSFADEPPPTG